VKNDLQNQKNNLQKSQDSSEDQQKTVKRKAPLLNRLIFVICCSVIAFVGINFISCNFMLPGSINMANVKGELRNPPPLDCKESERKGYDALITIMTTIIALKTRIEDID